MERAEQASARCLLFAHKHERVPHGRVCVCFCEARNPVTPFAERRMWTPEQAAGHVALALE
eukprot:3177007-Amphidinium_carterae.1